MRCDSVESQPMTNLPKNSAAEIKAANSDDDKKPRPSLIDVLIWRPVAHWYIQLLEAQQSVKPSQNLPSASEWQVIRQQAVIGWLQSVLLAIVIVQVIFAGMLRALPPDIRSALAFLHRIEWGAYAGIILIAAQVAVGWSSQIVLTNRYYLLAWRFSSPKLIVGQRARFLQIAYLALAIVMIGAAVWVRLHGFIVTPTK